MGWKLKQIRFNEQMEHDFNQVKVVFKNAFGIEPSTTQIQTILLQSFRENETKIKRKPKSKDWVII